MKMKKNEKYNCVAHAFVQISKNGTRSKKFGHPCSRALLMVSLYGPEWSFLRMVQPIIVVYFLFASLNKTNST